jgi:hypothetical protein
MPEVFMSVEGRLSGLEATVKAGFDTAARDRLEVKDALDAHNETMKEFMGEIKSTLKDHDARLDAHDTILDQIKGGKKVLLWMWSGFLALWGMLEGFIHLFGNKKQ